jgi:hypothetical protein
LLACLFLSFVPSISCSCYHFLLFTLRCAAYEWPQCATVTTRRAQARAQHSSGVVESYNRD